MKAKFYWGKTGSGKTLHTVIDVLVDYLAGRQIWSNMTFYGIPFHKVDMLDLIDMVSNENPEIDNNTPKTLVLDEIQTAFDGRRAMSRSNIDLSLFVSQCRKRGFNIIYTSQYISGADPRMRVLTDNLIRCISIKNSTDVGYGDISNPEPKLFRFFNMDLQTATVRKQKIPRSIARAFYKFYNTYEVIRPVGAYA